MDFLNRLGNSVTEASKIFRKNAPGLLTATSIATGVAAMITAVQATPEAKEKYDEIMAKDIPKKEKVKEMAIEIVPLYSGAIILETLSVTSSIGSYKIHKKRLAKANEAIAGLSAAYLISRDKLKKMKDEVVEKFGENVSEEIEKSIAEKSTDQESLANVQAEEALYIGEEEKERFQDWYTNQVFYGTREEVCRIFSNIRVDLQSERLGDTISVNLGFLEELPGNKKCPAGDNGGWVVGSRYGIEPWPKFTKMIFDDGKPGTLITYDVDDEFPIINAEKERRYF